MLLNDFFFISAEHQEEGVLHATLTLDATHRIFDGHFPGQPVVPGVCMMMMVREVLQASLEGRTVQLLRADHAKFLSLIDPRMHPSVELELRYSAQLENEMKVTSRLYKAEIIFFKYQALFRIS